MTRNSISSPARSFVETAVYELQKQMHEQRIELIRAGAVSKDKLNKPVAPSQYWLEDFQDMPGRNIVIPMQADSEKPGICLLMVDAEGKCELVGQFIITDENKIDEVHGTGFFWGFHSFKEALKRAELVLMEQSNITENADRLHAPYVPSEECLDKLRDGYNIMDLLTGEGVNASSDTREGYLEAMYSLWKTNMKPALDDLIWG